MEPEAHERCPNIIVWFVCVCKTLLAFKLGVQPNVEIRSSPTTYQFQLKYMACTRVRWNWMSECTNCGRHRWIRLSHCGTAQGKGRYPPSRPQAEFSLGQHSNVYILYSQICASTITTQVVRQRAIIFLGLVVMISACQ